MRLAVNNDGTLGCDISYYQGVVSFEKMKSAGISFVLIRAGYGQTIDKNFVTYINAAIKAGLKVGVYWFIYARTAYYSKLNAHKLIEVIKPYLNMITYGIWCDYEYDSDIYAQITSADKRTELIEAFMNELKGYEIGLYSNQDYIKNGKFTKTLVAKYPLWFAKYSENRGVYSLTGKEGHCYFWQYSSKGNGQKYGVSSKYLDLDFGYVTDKQVDTDTYLDTVQSNNAIIRASQNPYPKPKRTLKYQKGKYIMHGDDVKWVQWHLWRFGLLLDKNGIPDATQIDGYYGPNTDSKVKIAQQRRGLKVDGIVGAKTLEDFESV